MTAYQHYLEALEDARIAEESGQYKIAQQYRLLASHLLADRKTIAVKLGRYAKRSAAR